VLLTTIRQGVTDRWPDEVDVAKLNRLIASAVRFYSRFNPTIEELSVTTVANQKEYDLIALGATGCIGVREVLWYPAGATSNELRATEEWYRLLTQPVRYSMPSQRVIDDINQSAHIANMSGAYWYDSAESKLTIFPEPTVGGETVLVRYYATHAISGTTTYPTIPDADLDLIVGLVIADLLDAQGFAAAMSPDYAEGLEKVSFGKMGESTMTRAEELRGRVALKYGGGGAIVAP